MGDENLILKLFSHARKQLISFVWRVYGSAALRSFVTLPELNIVLFRKGFPSFQFGFSEELSPLFTFSCAFVVVSLLSHHSRRGEYPSPRKMLAYFVLMVVLSQKNCSHYLSSAWKITFLDNVTIDFANLTRAFCGIWSAFPAVCLLVIVPLLELQSTSIFLVEVS